MKTIIKFQKCIQDSQDFGSNDEHMVSRVFFELEINGRLYKSLSVDIKEIVGGNFETTPIEVGRPAGYRGPLNYKEFRKVIEQYYRSLVGTQGSDIRVPGGGSIKMRNNLFIKESSAEFETDIGDMGW